MGAKPKRFSTVFFQQQENFVPRPDFLNGPSAHFQKKFYDIVRESGYRLGRAGGCLERAVYLLALGACSDGFRSFRTQDWSKNQRR